MAKQFVPLFFITAVLTGCQSNTDKNLESLDKKSAREVTLITVTDNDKVYHITRQNIWLNGEKIAEKTDTITTSLKENTWGNDSLTKKLNEVPIYVTVQ